MYKENDVCIVGVGCFLPRARNPDEFWRFLVDSKPAFQELSQSRIDRRAHIKPLSEDKIPHMVAACIDDSDYQAICKSNGLDLSKTTRLQAMALEATAQALKDLKIEEMGRAAIILGCGWLDNQISLLNFVEEASSIDQKLSGVGETSDTLRRFFEERKSALQEYDQIMFSTSVLQLLRQKFSIKGESFMVDAACASSLAAMDIAITRLQTHDADMVLCGGVDSCLTPELQLVFSKTQTLASNGCYPFDKRANGLLQGEGAAIFALQRLRDARAQGNKIYGVFRGCAAASDGRTESLFAPSLKGQSLAIQKALVKANDWKYDFIECHGTGTKLGDAVELQTLDAILADYQSSVPIGSLKALIGHTKATAGAASVLKCVLSVKERKIPGSAYFRNFQQKVSKIRINAGTIDFEEDRPMRFGVSSFGFGGINYHLLLEEYSHSEPMRPVPIDENPMVVLIANSYVDFDQAKEFIKESNAMMPRSVKQIDRVQLMALAAFEKALKECAVDLKNFDTGKITIISASCLCLDALRFVAKRMRMNELMVSDFPVAAKDVFKQYQHQFPKITEDSGPGTLNNVIAARICNRYDLQGKSYNIDSDFNSMAVAIKQACLELRTEESELVAVLACREKLSENTMHIERLGVECFIFSTEKKAIANGCKIVSTIGIPNHHESNNE